MAVRSLERGQAALDQLQSCRAEGTPSLLPLDITVSVSVASAVAIVAQDFGRIDAIINNAGVLSKADDDLSVQLSETFQLNTFAPALLREAFVPYLQRSADP